VEHWNLMQVEILLPLAIMILMVEL
jgi:hypothetical protein